MDADRRARFCDLYRAHYFHVHRKAWFYVGDVTLAHDIAQEVFFKAWAALDAGNEQVLERRYLLRIATNHCIDHVRARRGRESVPFDELALTLLDSPLLEGRADAAGGAERTVYAREIFERLPRKLQPLAVYRFVEGYGLDEIVALTGLSRRTVQRRLDRARAWLARQR